MAIRIDELIRSTEECLRLLRGLDEGARRSLAAGVIERYLADRHPVGALAVYGTATLSAIRKVRPWAHDDGALFVMLMDRRPAWLAEWTETEIAPWAAVRRMVREGVCPRPASENYILGMIQAVGVERQALLRGDPGLLDGEVWRLFEIEGRPDCSLAQFDKYANPDYQWAPALVTLSREGLLDRDQLLTASLDALARGFKQFTAGWFSRFHEMLEPTADERATRVAKYLRLLGSPVPPTVSFALGALDALERARRLDGRALLDAVEPVLFARQPGTVERALKLIASVAKRERTLQARAGAVAVAAMEHPAAAVQKRVLALLDSIGQRQTQATAIEAASPIIAPSIRVLAGIAAPEAIERGGAPGSVADPFDESRRIVPVGTVEELVPAWLRVLEHEGPPEELERVLDGASRLCVRPLGRLERLAAPLAKRARQVEKRPEWRLWRISKVFAALAIAWIEGRDAGDWTVSGGSAVRAFLSERVREVAVRILTQHLHPLAGLPTHAGGWITEDVARARASLPTDPFDHRQWQLRTPGSGGDAGFLRNGIIDAPEVVRWASTIAPYDREVWFEAGIKLMEHNLDWWSAAWGNRVYLEALLEPYTRLGAAGERLLVLGLAAKESGEGTVATDALVATIAEGRLTEAALGRELARLVKNPEIKLRRVAARLTQAAAATSRHAAAIHGALSAMKRPSAFRQLYADLEATLGTRYTRQT